MKVQGNATGKNEGFKIPEDGWHIVKFNEGIAVLQKDGKDLTNDKGDKLWKIPVVIDDENDASNEAAIDQLAYEDDRGEQVVANMLACTKLLDKFEKAFPGDRSFFEPDIMDKIKTKLPGTYAVFKTEKFEDKKKNTRIRLLGWGPISFKDKLDELDKQLFPEKHKAGAKTESGKKGGEKTAPAAQDDGF